MIRIFMINDRKSGDDGDGDDHDGDHRYDGGENLHHASQVRR